MKPEPNFSLKPYFSAVAKELEGYGFQVEIDSVQKGNASDDESAFIKANTQKHILQVQSDQSLDFRTHSDAKLKIKFEVDIDSRYALSKLEKPHQRTRFL